jgi:hypothetical protein
MGVPAVKKIVILLLGGVPSVLFGAKTTVTFCGYPIASFGDVSPHVQIAGTIYETQDAGGKLSYQLPMAVALSRRGSDEVRLLHAVDGVVRAAVPRIKNSELVPIEVESIRGPLKDLAMIGVDSVVDAGRRIPARVRGSHTFRWQARKTRRTVPVLASLDFQGEVTLHIPNASLVVKDLIAHQKKWGQRLTAHTHGSVSVNSPSGESIQSISMVSSEPGVLTVFGLTEKGIYSFDLDFAPEGFAERAYDLKFNRRMELEDYGIIRALSGDFLTVATSGKEGGDQVSRVDLAQGETTLMGQVPGHLIGLSGAMSEAGFPSLAALSFSENGNKVWSPQVYLYSGESFFPIEIQTDRVPVALFHHAFSPDPALWQERIESEFVDGLWVSRRELTERDHREIVRLMVLVRRGTQYSLHSVIEGKEGRTLSKSNWLYIGTETDQVVADLYRAGFDLAELRENLDLEKDLRPLAHGLKTQLQEHYGFLRFDSAHPQTYRGAADLVTSAWRQRLTVLRDLRMTGPIVSGTLGEFGIKTFEDQVTALELMQIENHRIAQGMQGQGIEISGLKDQDWHEWLIEQAATMKGLAKPVWFRIVQLNAFYEKRLKDFSWDEVKQRYENKTFKPGTLTRALFLLSEHYLGTPFKHTVGNFLEYAKTKGWEDQINLTALQAIDDFLQSRDPLRKLNDSPRLIEFLKGH